MDFSNISNEKQQQYIHARFEFEELETKEVLSDDEYEVALKIVNDNGNEEQIKQFNDRYVSRTYYDREKNRLEGIIDRVNSLDSRINNELIGEENRFRATTERENLRKIRDYYRSFNSGIMRNLDVDNMSDEAVIMTYRMVARTLDNDTLNQIINSDVESVDNGHEDTNNRVKLFVRYCDRVEEGLNEINSSLVLDDINLEINSTVERVNEQIARLDTYSKKVISEIDGLRQDGVNTTFDMEVPEINNKVNDLKNRLKDLKRSHIDKYNAKVEATNRHIYELKRMTDLSEDVAREINKLVSLNRCNINISKWNHKNYLGFIDYKGLINTNEIISRIEDKLNIKSNNKELDTDIEHIENQLVNVLLKLKDDISDEEYIYLKQDVELLNNNINEFKIKLENNKDKLSVEEYNDYLNKVNNFEKRLESLKDKVVKNDSSEYKKLLDKIDDIDKEIVNIDNLNESLNGKIEDDKLSILKDKLNEYEPKLDEILKIVNEKHDNKELDDIQYNNLVNKINDVKKKVNERINKLNKTNEENINEEDILSMLDGKIDDLEKAIDKVIKQVNILDTPIKDKNIRKKINDIIKKLENEFNDLKNKLEEIKDDSDKYSEMKSKIDEVGRKLDELNKNYHKKCPLLVKNVKDGKEFYKKHKKLVLIGIGLSTIALVHATVGPVIIPAIMRGNIMIMNNLNPANTGFLTAVNKVLGKVINATEVTKLVQLKTGEIAKREFWYLANGTMLNTPTTSAALLKGIAMSTIGSAIIAAPVIALLVETIKKIIQKMKTYDLKHTINEVIVNEKNKISEKVDDIKTSVQVKKDKVKSSVSEKIEELKSKKEELINHEEKKTVQKLFEEYIFSAEDDFDAYCNKNNLDEEEKYELREKLVSHGLLDEKDRGAR